MITGKNTFQQRIRLSGRQNKIRTCLTPTTAPHHNIYKKDGKNDGSKLNKRKAVYSLPVRLSGEMPRTPISDLSKSRNTANKNGKCGPNKVDAGRCERRKGAAKRTS